MPVHTTTINKMNKNPYPPGAHILVEGKRNKEDKLVKYR